MSTAMLLFRRLLNYSVCNSLSSNFTIRGYAKDRFFGLENERRRFKKHEDGTQGEKTFLIDQKILEGRFPTIETLQQTFDGTKYADLPIVHITCTKNNTKTCVSSPDGKRHFAKSNCGMEGFKNCKKKTNVAGQAVGVSTGLKTLEAGIRTVRVELRGFGPGRMTCVRGLQLSGLNIVALTDKTPLPELGPRPRGPRSV